MDRQRGSALKPLQWACFQSSLPPPTPSGAPEQQGQWRTREDPQHPPHLHLHSACPGVYRIDLDTAQTCQGKGHPLASQEKPLPSRQPSKPPAFWGLLSSSPGRRGAKGGGGEGQGAGRACSRSLCCGEDQPALLLLETRASFRRREENAQPRPAREGAGSAPHPQAWLSSWHHRGWGGGREGGRLPHLPLKKAK